MCNASFSWIYQEEKTVFAVKQRRKSSAGIHIEISDWHAWQISVVYLLHIKFGDVNYAMENLRTLPAPHPPPAPTAQLKGGGPHGQKLILLEVGDPLS